MTDQPSNIGRQDFCGTDEAKAHKMARLGSRYDTKYGVVIKSVQNFYAEYEYPELGKHDRIVAEYKEGIKVEAEVPVPMHPMAERS